MGLINMQTKELCNSKSLVVPSIKLKDAFEIHSLNKFIMSKFWNRYWSRGIGASSEVDRLRDWQKVMQ